MKRILTAAAVAGLTLAGALPASAYTSSAYGSVKLTWNVAVNASLVVHTNYTTSGTTPFFANNTTNNSLMANGGSSACGTAPAGTTDLTLNYGTITTSSTTVTSCTWKSAVGFALTTNDGYLVSEYIASSDVPTNTGFCAYPNVPASFGATTAGSTNAGAVPAGFISTRAADAGAGTFSSGVLTACAGTGSIVTLAAGTDTAGAGAAEPNAVPTATFLNENTTATGLALMGSTTAPASSPVYASEDLQLDLNANVATTSTPPAAYMTVQLLNS